MESTLGQLCSAIVDCEHKTAPADPSGRYYSIGTRDISGGGIKLESAKRVSEATYENWTARMKPGRDDLILAREAPVGQVGWISVDDLICLGQRTVLLRPNPEVAVPRWLHYRLLAPDMQHEMSMRAAGSTVPHLNVADIRLLPISEVPSRQTQHAIAEILGALDDKIELNRRMNVTLEGIVRAIFKSWFVDFDLVRAKMEGREPFGIDASAAAAFPERLTVTELGEIPEGWKVGRLDDLVSISRAATNPLNAPNDLFDHYSIPAFDEGKRPVRQRGEEIRSNKFLIKKGCVLVSRLNPRIPRVWLPDPADDVQSVCSTEFAVALPLPPFTMEFMYGLLSSYGFQEQLATLVTGTSGSHQRVKPADLQQMPVVIPDSPKVHMFAEVVAPALMRMSGNVAESATLAALQDLLLPKLISGEVRIRDAEQMAEAAL